MDKLKQLAVARSFNRFTSRYKIFFDGLPFLMSLVVGGFFMTRLTKKRYIKDSLHAPTKEDMLAAGVDIDTDLASAELAEELKKLRESFKRDDWKNVPVTKSMK